MTTPAITLMTVYDGKRAIGFILERGKLGFEAFDADQRTLGILGTAPEAAAAIPERQQ